MWYNFFGGFMLIDTHCHLSYETYENLDEIVKNMDGIMIASGCDDKTNKEVLELVNKYDNVYGTLGIHPTEIDKITSDSFKIVEDNLNNPKIVAIGEIGLDYYWINYNKDKQKEIFEYQLKLANKYNKPVVVHSREAIQDTYDILRKYNLRGSIHCFSSSLEMAKEFIKLGYKIGIGGTLTFKNSKKLQEIVKEIDLSNILIETDSPYLSPDPFRGKKNKPSNVYYVASKIAELKNIDINEVLFITNRNAIEIFDLNI
ncbi:MAG: TatD family deoxyribonuclease [Firmicutes bacterium]|nr:TatD family deoxyribonuclease [Bacillota bacterium]